MARFDDLLFRDCPHCKAGIVQMTLNEVINARSAAGDERSWAVMTCPRCAGVVTIEFESYRVSNDTEKHARLMRQFPEEDAGTALYRVEHLPDDLQNFLQAALRVKAAGIPDAAAVQLRKVLEGAAAHKGVDESRLVTSIQKLIDDGHITKDFGRALHHVRKVGNVGAHYSSETIDMDEVDRVLRFTVQLLRNLFEVPGELDILQAAEPDSF